MNIAVGWLIVAGWSILLIGFVAGLAWSGTRHTVTPSDVRALHEGAILTSGEAARLRRGGFLP